MHDDSSFYCARQSIEEFIIFLDVGQPVLCPVVLEVVVDLPVQIVWQRPVVTESSEQSGPIMQFESLLLDASLVKTLNDTDEASHDEREIGYAAKHDYDDYDHFSSAYRV